MKKKLLFMVCIAILTVCFFALSVSADTIEVADDGENELTLGQGTIANLDGVTIPSPTSGLVYTIDTETLTASVSGRGSFTGGVLSFPSSITYGDVVYTVTKINSNLFQGLSYDLYVPDSVTFIGGGGGKGTFGNSTIGYIYIGSGLVGFEQETFSGSRGFKSFVCKAKPTYVGVYAFNQNSASAEFSGFELDLTHVVRIENFAFSNATFMNKGEITFGDCIEFIGSDAFVSSKAKGSIVIPANCTLSYRCFNGTSFEFVCIRVPKGETRYLPQELFSGSSGPLTVVIDGNATTDKPHILSGNKMDIYMPTLEQAQTLATAIGKQGNNGRLVSATFYVCENGHKYSSASDGTLTDLGEIEKHYYTAAPVTFEANCVNGRRESYVCYCCGNENIVNEDAELGKHIFNVSVKEVTCQSSGYREYTCTVCGLQQSAHFVGTINHIGTVKEYELKDSQSVKVTTKCRDCSSVVSIVTESLVNKCYIEGYGYFDASLEYVSISADGVATPKAYAEFSNAVIYFPSFVEIDGTIVEVKIVEGFKGKSIKAIYIPDTVTRIVGGAGKGCFGDSRDLKNVVVGKGVTAIEQETFCIGTNIYLDEFIFKGVITRIEYIALQRISANSTNIPYQFDTNLVYVGKQVNLNGDVIREVRIAKGCDLSEKFAFNNANGLTTVYIEGGDTPEEALDLGQEFASNTSTKNYYIKGYVTVSGQAVFAGIKDLRVYMSSTDAIDVFTTEINKYGYDYRMNDAVFFDCETGKAWFVKADTDRVEHTSVAFAHGGVIAEIKATCTQNGSVTESCFVCGKVVSVNETEMLSHAVDSGVITKMPTVDERGTIVYSCAICGQTEEKEIFALSEIHGESVKVVYENGYASFGSSNTICSYCDYVASTVLNPVVEILGFSTKEDGTGLVCGYKIDKEALKYCEDYMTGFEFGFVVANALDVENAKGLFDENNKILTNVRGFKVKLTSNSFSYLDVSVVGANTEQLQNADFLLGLYAWSDSDGNGEMERTYIQHTLENGNNKSIIIDNQSVNTISIKRASESSAS